MNLFLQLLQFTDGEICWSDLNICNLMPEKKEGVESWDAQRKCYKGADLKKKKVGDIMKTSCFLQFHPLVFQTLYPGVTQCGFVC